MPASDNSRSPDELINQVRFLEAEVTDLRRRLSDGPVHSHALEQRLADTQRSLAAVTSEDERLAQTPAGFGTFLARNEDDSIDVFTGGRKLRVNVSPGVDLDTLQRGQEVM